MEHIPVQSIPSGTNHTQCRVGIPSSILRWTWIAFVVNWWSDPPMLREAFQPQGSSSWITMFFSGMTATASDGWTGSLATRTSLRATSVQPWLSYWAFPPLRTQNQQFFWDLKGHSIPPPHFQGSEQAILWDLEGHSTPIFKVQNMQFFLGFRRAFHHPFSRFTTSNFFWI